MSLPQYELPLVWLSKRSFHSQTHGNPDGLITHSQSKGGNWCILSPREETGGVFSHALDSTEPAASSLALDSTSLHDVRMMSNTWMSILGLSQAFWLLVGVGTGNSGGKSCFHQLASSLYYEELCSLILRGMVLSAIHNWCSCTDSLASYVFEGLNCSLT